MVEHPRGGSGHTPSIVEAGVAEHVDFRSRTTMSRSLSAYWLAASRNTMFGSERPGPTIKQAHPCGQNGLLGQAPRKYLHCIDCRTRMVCIDADDDNLIRYYYCRCCSATVTWDARRDVIHRGWPEGVELPRWLEAEVAPKSVISLLRNG